MKIKCPHCDAKLKAQQEDHEQLSECPECKNSICIPALELNPPCKTKNNKILTHELKDLGTKQKNIDSTESKKSIAKKIFNFVFFIQRYLAYSDNEIEKTQNIKKTEIEKAEKYKELEKIRSGGNITIPAIKPYSNEQNNICNYCKKEISTDAKMCPHCGSNFSSNVLSVFLIFAVVVFLIIGMVSCNDAFKVHLPLRGYKENAISDTLEAVLYLKSTICFATAFILWGLLNLRWK